MRSAPCSLHVLWLCIFALLALTACGVEDDGPPRYAAPGASIPDASTADVALPDPPGPAQLEWSQARVDFGPVTPGLESPPAVLILRNAGGTGTGTITVRIDNDQFLVDGRACTQLLPEGTCSVQIRYAPRSSGPSSLLAHLVAADGYGKEVALDVIGQRKPTGKLQIDRPTFEFPYTVIGEVARGQTFRVQNQGTTPAVVEPIALFVQGGDPVFTIVADTCSNNTLEPSATCDVTVTARPTTSNVHVASLEVGPVGAPGPDSWMELRIYGLPPAALSAQLQGQVGSVTSGGVSTVSVSVKNDGGGRSGPMSVALDGPDRDLFRIVSDGCSAQSLPPGAQTTCWITLDYLPVVVGDKHATLTLTATPGGSVVVALDGGCTSRTPLAPWGGGHYVDPEFIEGLSIVHVVNGTTYAGRSFANSTPVPLALPPVRVAGTGYRLHFDSCGGRTLASGASCEVTVRLTAAGAPSAAGMLVLGTGPSLLVQPLSSGSNDPIVSSPSWGLFRGVAVGSHVDLTLGLVNKSPVAVTFVPSIDPNEGNVDQFQVVSTTCNSEVTPGQQCEAVVRFTPSVADAAYGRLDTGVGGYGVTLAGWGK